MRRPAFFQFCIIFLFLFSGIPAFAAQSPGKWTPGEMMKVKSIDSLDISPDGGKVVYTVQEAKISENNNKYVSQLFLTDVKNKDTFQLTRGEASCRKPSWSPDGKLIAFLTFRSGKTNIWLIRPNGGEAWQLTDGATHVESFQWSPDGSMIAFTMPEPPDENEEKAEKEDRNVVVVGADDKMSCLWLAKIPKTPGEICRPQQLTRANSSVNEFSWSPDSSTIAFSHALGSGTNYLPTMDISVINIKSKKVTPLLVSGAAEGNPVFSPDGKWIAYTSTGIPPAWYSFNDIYIVPAEGGYSRILAKTWEQDSTIIDWSADGKNIFYREFYKTSTRLCALPIDGKPPVTLYNTGKYNQNFSFDKTCKLAAFAEQAWNEPVEVFISQVGRTKPTRISSINNALPRYPLGKTEVLRWKAPDGKEIEGLLTYPVDYKPGRKYPLILSIHGGPAGSFFNSFIGVSYCCPVAALAADGYCVLRCNIRGSCGYGAEFRKAIQRDWGGKDYEDLMAGVDHVIAMGIADSNRLGVEGYSYGGYMTSFLITKTSRFKAAVEGGGLTNLISFTGTTDVIDLIPSYFECTFCASRDLYLERSALYHVEKVTTPLLIQHGSKDNRVPVGQGYEMYNALKQLGKTVKMIEYPDSTHGGYTPKRMIKMMEENMEWFGKYVLNASENEK